jgi:shikimate kinase
MGVVSSGKSSIGNARAKALNVKCIAGDLAFYIGKKK